MKKSKKIWLCIAGILLIALGVLCIMKPTFILVSTTWVLGLVTVLIGLSKLIFTFRTQAYVPYSGSRMLSGLIDIFFGFFILGHMFGVAMTIPVLFSIWVIIQGISVAVQSFDYRKCGFSGWWMILILGICGAVLGFFGMRNLDVAAATLSSLIGIAIIILGVANILALFGVSRFEIMVKEN